MSLDRSPKLRLFFALWPDARLQEQIAQSVSPYLQGSQARPVKVANLHVTLAFLGSVPVSDVAKIIDSAAGVSGRAFDLSLERLQSWRAAHVACVMIEPSPPALTELAANLRIELLEQAVEVDRKDFRAHLTVARDWRDRRIEERIGPLMWRVREFVLAESKEGQGGPNYHIVHRWPLHE